MTGTATTGVTVAPGAEDLALLLVDDVAENLMALEAALAPLGHRMVLARSGEEALRELLKGDDFAAVVLDVQMPGLDGFETAAAIRQRERTRDLPIVFLTAISRDEEHRQKGFATGGVDYIFKPVDPDLLKAKVGVFVRLYATERALRRQSDELARQAVELARSNADLDQFASVVSHDLMDPLNVISGYLELLGDRSGSDLDTQARDWIETMQGCAQRMHEMVASVLAYSRAVVEGGDRDHRPSARLSDALADATADLAALLAGSASRVDAVGDLPEVAGSRRELAQILQNLVANSVTHAGGGPVRVTVAAEVAGPEVTVSVTDDGPGLDPAQMERVFGLFERGAPGTGPVPSTGLGLAICRRTVERLGGRIWMEPAPERGVAVRFTLPAAGSGPGGRPGSGGSA